MKPTTYLLLLPILAAAQVKEQYCFTPVEIDSLYVIGKEWQFYKKEYPKRIAEIDTLTWLIVERDASFQGYLTKQTELDNRLKVLTDEKEALAVKLTMQKYDIAETWLGRAWDWITIRSGAFLIGAGAGAAGVYLLTLNK